MLNFLKQLLDWIYKNKCYVCGSTKESVKVCSECFDSLEERGADLVKIPMVSKVKVYSSGIYTKNIQKLIRGLKYHQQKELAYYLAKFMYDYGQKCGLDSDYVIVPVPLHPKRHKERGYNHMELVAAEYCRLSGCKPNTSLIKRVKDTKPQYRLSSKEREANLKNAFSVDKSSYNGEKLIIMDDILTTGTTVKEIIKEFKKAGVKDITIFATSCTASFS